MGSAESANNHRSEVLVILLQISMFIGTIATSRSGEFAGLVLRLLVGAQLVATIGVDLFNNAATIYFWRTRSNPETLDLLRMTRRDTDLLLAYQAAAEMRTWRAMRIETITRLIIPAMLAILCVLVSPAIFTALIYMTSPNGIIFLILALLLLVFVVRIVLLYVREPLLRMRVVVALSMLVATQVRDTTTATMISGSIIAILRFLQFVLVYALAAGTLHLLTEATFSYEQHPLTILLWLGLLSVGLTPLVRRGYNQARLWLLQRIETALRA